MLVVLYKREEKHRQSNTRGLLSKTERGQAHVSEIYVSECKHRGNGSCSRSNTFLSTATATHGVPLYILRPAPYRSLTIRDGGEQVLCFGVLVPSLGTRSERGRNPGGFFFIRRVTMERISRHSGGGAAEGSIDTKIAKYIAASCGCLLCFRLITTKLNTILRGIVVRANTVRHLA